MRYIPRRLIDEIANRSDIIEIVGRYVELKRIGRSFRGLCPFHEDKNPSFFVDPERKLYHCFGCSAGGDIFTFIEDMENLSFPQAVKWLADQIGFPPLLNLTPKEKANERIIELNEIAANFYHQFLFKEEGKRARDFLEKRGIAEDTFREFLLGWVPAFSGIVEHAKRFGFTERSLYKAGLIVGRKGLDSFQQRLLFPIHNDKGRIVGFAGRALDEKLNPKYINSAGSDIFRKGELLYGLSKTRRSFRRRGAIVVEGYLDLLTLFQAGIDNAVAIMGTALTSGQINLLKRYTKSIYLCLDSDTAGYNSLDRISASLNVLRKDSNISPSFKVISLPEGLDPADFIQLKGREAFIELVNKATSILEFELERSLRCRDMDSLTDKMEAVREIIPIISGVNRLESEIAVSHLAKALSIEQDAIFREIERSSSKDSLSKEEYLIDILCELRNKLSSVSGLKSRFILPDQTIRQIATCQPETFEELEAIRGIGEIRLAKYGRLILAILIWDRSDIDKLLKEYPEACRFGISYHKTTSALSLVPSLINIIYAAVREVQVRRTTLAKILIGYESKMIKKKGYDKLRCYGRLEGMSQNSILGLIDELIDRGYFEFTDKDMIKPKRVRS